MSLLPWQPLLPKPRTPPPSSSVTAVRGHVSASQDSGWSRFQVGYSTAHRKQPPNAPTCLTLPENCPATQPRLVDWKHLVEDVHWTAELAAVRGDSRSSKLARTGTLHGRKVAMTAQTGGKHISRTSSTRPTCPALQEASPMMPPALLPMRSTVRDDSLM